MQRSPLDEGALGEPERKTQGAESTYRFCVASSLLPNSP
ncbi:unnamed protein product [Acidithrix sp. C25]|nr:unnamed protein product [Acidithrix sp. C25]